MRFQVIPAIDLREGRCVRLFQGDYARETRYPGDPVEVAQRWQALGAPLIHVVDLDGAREGRRVNQETVAAICRAVSVPVEVSGGLRTMADLEAARAAGAGRLQIGSAAVRDPGFVAEAVRTFPGMVVVAVDARGGRVMTDGWEQDSGLEALAFARAMIDLGVPRLLYTDISRDGAMEGPNIAAYAELVAAVPVPVVAAGGVTTIEHLRALAAAGCEGAVIGRALYEGALDLKFAVEELARC